MSGEMDSVDSVDTYSTGMASGYGATPFKMDDLNSSYIHTNGYLYASGYNNNGEFGLGHATQQNSFVKVGTTTTGGSPGGFYKPIDYDFCGLNGSGIVVDQYGKVWTAGGDTSGSLGWGSSYSSSSYQYFRTVATGTGNYLPSNYTAVAVAAGGGYGSLILTSTGALYGAGNSAALGGNTNCASGTFYRLDGLNSLPAATTSNPIVDFQASCNASWVLYKDGSLYKGTSSWTKMNPSGVTFKMFDSYSRVNSYCYAVDTNNKIYYATSSASTMTYITTAVGTVTQIRGQLDAFEFGYLNSSNVLYMSSSSSTTVPASSNVTLTGTTFYQITNVSYFDYGGASSNSFGIIQNGVTKFWGYNGSGQLGDGTTTNKTFASPVTPSNVDTSYMPEPLDRDISNTPPANCHFPRK